MPTLVIDNVPASLLERIQDLAKSRRKTPGDTALALLEVAIREPTSSIAEAPLPQAPFLTEEISVPCSIPWPEGKRVQAVRVSTPMPSPHDLPDEE